jgi:hypothetical protein
MGQPTNDLIDNRLPEIFLFAAKSAVNNGVNRRILMAHQKIFIKSIVF